MAGRPGTAELVVATRHAGALGILAGGYKTAEAMAAEMAAVRRQLPRRSASTCSCRVRRPPNRRRWRRISHRSSARWGSSAPRWAKRRGTGRRTITDKVEAWLGRAAGDGQLHLRSCPPVTSDYGDLQAAGTLVVLTVTTEDEAALALGGRCCAYRVTRRTRRGQLRQRRPARSGPADPRAEARQWHGQATCR